MNDFFLQTERIGLRKFRPADLDAFASINADPHVMEFFPNRLSRFESQEYMDRINAKIQQQGFGFWAAENLFNQQLMGFVGLTQVSCSTDFTPAVEIGWRLGVDYWGQGLATEAARACLSFGFDDLGLERIVSFTSPLNQRSWRVMQRLGMSLCGEFDHPLISEGHVLRRHVWYSIEPVDFWS